MNIGSQHVLRIFPGLLSPTVQSTAISVGEFVTSQEAIQVCLSKLAINDCSENFELVEVCYRNSVLEHESEKVLQDSDFPIQLTKSWEHLTPSARTCYRIFIREKKSADFEEIKVEPLRQNWMDCHEHISTMIHFQLDLECRLGDDDLCQLPNLDEEMLLKHLQERFEQGRIYTYVGEILLAVNPFRFFPIYNPKFITAYNNKNLGSLPPHIFAIADISFHRMLKEKKSQCIVISGESGSGKTESTKLIVHHLTALSRKSQATAIEKTVLGVGPVLEAFGNAKTAYNNNSSRFGKFTQIKFREDGAVSGAALRKYLLEKSRIVSQAPEERNYHVFYYLLAGAPPELKEALHLTEPQDYCYLNQSKCYTIEGIDESYEYLRLKQSMDMVGFSTDVQERIFRALSAVLHIGNIQFIQKPGDEDEVKVQNMKELTIISKLMMVTEEKLIDVLTTRKQITRGEQFIVPYKYQEALATRDAMAKALYGALFDWIVLQVNHVLVIKQQSPKEWCSIGVLDIFGFEDFQYNSFEQLCINFANEKLQYYFNQHIFKLEQDEYTIEGINWRNVEFVDNYGCIELISGRPTGIMHLIDEESSFPGATKTSLLEKINKNHSTNSFYEPSLRNPSFVVKHYAGSVEYQITGFLDKNRDLMRPDILSILKSSNLRFIRELIGADPMAVYRWSVLRAFFKAIHAFIVSGRIFRTSGKANERAAARRKRASSKSFRMKLLSEEEQTIPYGESASLLRKASKVIRRIQSSKSTASSSKNFVSKIRQGLETKRDMSIRTYDYLYKTQRGKAAPKNPPTVSAQFQSSLNRLMEILGEAQPFFVRCIRSNAEKAPLKFDCDVVQRQLRYTGMLETVRIRRLGYQWRFHLEEFVKRYSLLFPRVLEDPKTQIPAVLKSLKLDPNEYQIGKSKIFLRESQHRILQDNLHDVFIANVCTIQRWTRRFLQRKHYLRQRSAAITIQARVRGHLARSDMSHKVYSATKLQATWRRHHAQISYRQTVRKMILIQTCIRGYLARKRYQALLIRKREEEEEERKRKRLADLAAVKKRPRLAELDSRRLVRSISDPSEYENLKKSMMEEMEETLPKTPTFKITTPDELLEPKNIETPRVKDLSQRFERDLVLVSPEDWRRRAVSDPASQRRLRMLPHPMPFTVTTERAEDEKPELPDVVKLNTVYSPAQMIELKNSTVDISCSAFPFPRGMKSKFRRSFSIKSKPKFGQRMSTSDIPDERPLTQYSMDDDLLDDSKPGSTEGLQTLTSLSSSSGDVRKSKGRSLFRRRNRNSLRRKSEPGLAKNNTKKQEKHEKNDIKPSRSTEELLKALKQTKIVSTISKSAITGNKQLKPTDKKVARGAADLGALESFLTNKISIMNREDNIRDTIVDRVFKKALHEFHTYLISERSLIINHGKNVSLKYEEMTSKFEAILGKIIKTERIGVTFPVIMGVNAFNGVLDEYFGTRAQALAKAEKSRAPKQNVKKRTKRKSDFVIHNNHKFGVAQFSIPTFCEHCNSLIWVLEKGMVCQDCRFTCHKKCHLKSTLFCVRNTHKTKSNSKRHSVFGGELNEMTAEDSPIPTVVERMVQDIEFRGLYAEGIYRKSPNAATVRALKNTIVANGIDEVDLTAYSVHVVASVLKLFFRQLASPVFTDYVYNEFIRSSELSDEKIQLETLYSLVDKLPQVNKEIFERLIFHLARIAENEESNLMHPNALSIIWAPCLMRTPVTLEPLESLRHVPKQTQCLETLICSQVKKIRSTMTDIRVLDKAADTTNKRLSMLNLHDEEQEQEPVEQDLTEGDEVKSLLTQQLEALQQQRDVLTANLTQLKPRRHKEAADSGEEIASDDNITDDELDLDTLENNEDYAVTFDLPAAPAALTHLTKHRAQLQANKRLPTRSKLR